MSNEKQYDHRLEVQKLTRYIPFTKYVDFLCNGLFCPKVLLFEDPWEGHVFHGVTAQQELRRPLAAVINNIKHWIYASCWHAADHESYAMWKIYGQLSEAVAIHTSLPNLKELMGTHCNREGDPIALLTAVQYVSPVYGRLPELDPDKIYSIRYSTTRDKDRALWLDIMEVCFGLKPHAYKYEEEVRLLILDREAPKFWEQTKATKNTDKMGLYVQISDYNSFLTGISVAPIAPSWFMKILEKTNEKFSIDKIPVARSSMFDAPVVHL